MELVKDMDGKLDFTNMEEETEEQDALELYQWSQELSYDDLSWQYKLYLSESSYVH